MLGRPGVVFPQRRPDDSHPRPDRPGPAGRAQHLRRQRRGAATRGRLPDQRRTATERATSTSRSCAGPGRAGAVRPPRHLLPVRSFAPTCARTNDHPISVGARRGRLPGRWPPGNLRALANRWPDGRTDRLGERVAEPPATAPGRCLRPITPHDEWAGRSPPHAAPVQAARPVRARPPTTHRRAGRRRNTGSRRLLEVPRAVSCTDRAHTRWSPRPTRPPLHPLVGSYETVQACGHVDIGCNCSRCAATNPLNDASTWAVRSFPLVRQELAHRAAA